jgi:pyruvate formate lyase activating enzyme
VTTGTIFDIKKFAIHDGPGVRTTVFFKGCPLGCWLCHNPESQAFEPELMLRDGRCDRCGDCIDVCEPIAISLNETAVHIDRARCDLCGNCVDVCLPEAIEIAGRQVTPEEVMREIEKDFVYYDESDGGVTFSGGEPLSQADFLVDLLALCKARGIRTAVDTCGYLAHDIFRMVAANVDLFLYDLKIIEDCRHTEFTGYSNQSIHENLRWLADNERPVIVRFPLLPGINDDEENVGALAILVSSLSNRYPVDVLPYHKAGVDKYARLDKEHRLPELDPPTEERIEQVVRQLKEYELQVTVRGERV